MVYGTGEAGMLDEHEFGRPEENFSCIAVEFEEKRGEPGLHFL